MSSTKEDTKTLEDILSKYGISASLENEYRLILWNDDHNSFEWVIVCLMGIMKYSYENAEKSAWTVHLEGKDVVKTGSKDTLEPYKKLLEERGLTVSIEE
jgi:ATP-dependent Clp protease adaptor protein ClpS